MLRIRNISAVLIFIFTCALPGLCVMPVEGEHYSWITLREARDLLGKPGATFIDVNEPEIYEQHHIAGSVHVTDEHLDHFLPKDKGATLVFYCYERRCTASHAAAREAVKLGYRHVLLMPEGIMGWVNAGLPTERGSAGR
jgi:rhodanese-related sulfurtransferase